MRMTVSDDVGGVDGGVAGVVEVVDICDGYVRMWIYSIH